MGAGGRGVARLRRLPDRRPTGRSRSSCSSRSKRAERQPSLGSGRSGARCSLVLMTSSIRRSMVRSDRSLPASASMRSRASRMASAFGTRNPPGRRVPSISPSRIMSRIVPGDRSRTHATCRVESRLFHVARVGAAPSNRDGDPMGRHYNHVLNADQTRWAIWIRLPQVSSKTAVVTGPISVGSWVKRTPSSRQPLVLGLHVVDGERGERDAVVDQRRP